MDGGVRQRPSRRPQQTWHLATRRLAAASIAAAALVLSCILVVPSPLFSKPVSMATFAADGSLLTARIAADGQWRLAETDSVPQKFATCLIAFEDKRFRRHRGIDPLAVCRALLNDLRHGRAVEGGSTLTMQLARMAQGNRRRTLRQKLSEALWAIGLELKLSKDEILSLYASHAPMGGNVVGLDAAAWRYFGRGAAELSWAESALLAVLPNAPARIHVARNRAALKSKRDRLLDKLLSAGEIDEATHRLAKAEALPERPFPMENSAPQLLEKVEKLYGRSLGTNHTTIDASLQRRVQQIADGYAARHDAMRVGDIGILVAEVASGNVLAYVGNTLRPSPTCMVDMISAERSSGSTLKPLLYASMLSTGETAPRTIWADTPLDINGFRPQNYSHTYSGAAHADRALTRSLNVPLVRMLTSHNVGRFLADLKQMGFTTLRFPEDHYGASLVLGGAEVTLWDLCGAYASMARRLDDYNSYPQRPALSSIFPLRLSANATPRPTPAVPSATLPTPAAIWHTLNAMSALSRPEEEAEWQVFSSMKKVAWKTGTSYGSRDAWAVGLNRGYVVGVWVGNATGEGRAGMTGVGFAAPVLFDVFSLLPATQWFDEPLDDEEVMAVCRHSGMRASGVCAETVSVRLPRQCRDSELCRYCRLAHLSPDGMWQVNSSCLPIAEIRTEARFVLPPAMEYYYRQHHADYTPLPPIHPECDDNASPRLAIVYPQTGQSVVRTRALDGHRQGIVCQVAAPAESEVFWHLDGKFVGKTLGEHKMAIDPKHGRNTLTVVDRDGARVSVHFSVKQ